MSDGLFSAIRDTNLLSELLDNDRNHEIVEGTSCQNTSPKTTLARLLSVHSTVSTSSSFATKNRAVFNCETIGFRKIGFGQCGLVFERPGWPYVAKVSRPGFGDALWSDFAIHVKVQSAFARHSQVDCKVPTVHGYAGQSDERWWGVMLPQFPNQSSDFPMPSNVLLTERILPLPKVTRSALIDLYCPESLRDSAKQSATNRDCLARVYLGRRRKDTTRLSPNFTLRNFNLHLDQILDLQLPVEDLAKTMGEALATVHWEANVDGYDIEFVLGSEPAVDYQAPDEPTFKDITEMQKHTSLEMKVTDKINVSDRITRLWCLDFNLCTSWPEETGWTNPDGLVEQLVLAFFENDPYYPLPLVKEDESIWSCFQESYLEKSTSIISGKDQRLQGLPLRFIEACVDRERQNLALGKGHGRREFKD